MADNCISRGHLAWAVPAAATIGAGLLYLAF